MDWIEQVNPNDDPNYHVAKLRADLDRVTAERDALREQVGTYENLMEWLDTIDFDSIAHAVNMAQIASIKHKALENKDQKGIEMTIIEFQTKEMSMPATIQVSNVEYQCYDLSDDNDDVEDIGFVSFIPILQEYPVTINIKSLDILVVLEKEQKKGIEMSYTKEQLMPKRYPQEKPSVNEKQYHIYTKSFYPSEEWRRWWIYDDYSELWRRHVDWFIDIPGAPEEVKPLAYPENKPEGFGPYLAHIIKGDKWVDVEWWKTRWACDIDEGDMTIDYFIPIRLDEPFGNSEQLECTGIPIISSSTLFAVEEFDNTISISDSPEEPGGISIDCDEFTVLAKRWLDQQGYDIIKREPEIAPCPNPECRNDKMHLEGCEDDMWYYCHKCGYAGPTANSKSEAGRLHNLIAGRE